MLESNMLTWLLRSVFFYGWRVAVTLACCLVVQWIIHREEYRVELLTVIEAAVLVIVVSRIWAKDNG